MVHSFLSGPTLLPIVSVRFEWLFMFPMLSSLRLSIRSLQIYWACRIAKRLTSREIISGTSLYILNFLFLFLLAGGSHTRERLLLDQMLTEVPLVSEAPTLTAGFATATN
jgi:hypothetical protein